MLIFLLVLLSIASLVAVVVEKLVQTLIMSTLLMCEKKRLGFYYRSKLRFSKCKCPLWTMVDLIKFLRAGQASAPLLDEVLLVLSNWYKRGHFGY